MLNHIFNPENKFFNFMNKIMDVLVIGVLWLLFSLPVVTAGAATCAVFNFTIKQTYDEEGYVFRSFVKGFRKNFRQATVAWLIIGSVSGFLLADLYICLNGNLPVQAERLVFSVLLCLFVLIFITALYVFPLQAMFHLNLKQLFSHAFIMAVGNIFNTLLLAVMAGIAGYLSWLFPIMTAVWAGLFMFLSSYRFRRVFRKYMDQDNGNN